MKQIKKSLIDEMIEAEKTAKKNTTTKNVNKCLKLSEEISIELYGDIRCWIAISNLFDSLLFNKSIKKCTNEEIYQILRILEIEVEE